MQQTLAEQFADVQNYETNRRDQQESARRHQRAELESRRIGGSPGYPVTSYGDSMAFTGSSRREDIYEADRWGTGSDGYRLSPGPDQSYQQRRPYSPTATPPGTAQSYQQRRPHSPTTTTAGTWQQQGEPSRSNGLRSEADSRRYYDPASYYSSPPEPRNRTYAGASNMMDGNTSWACPTCGSTNFDSISPWSCSGCGNQKPRDSRAYN